MATPISRPGAAWVLAGCCLAAMAGCAAKPQTPRTAVALVTPAEAPSDQPTSKATGDPAPVSADAEPQAGAASGDATSGDGEPEAIAPPGSPGKKPKKSVNPCRLQPSGDEPAIDDAHRLLYQTLCGAALWFDGLFGERNNLAVASARGTSGRLEISGLNSEYEGTKLRVRGNVRFDFPNFAKRWNAFLGRDDQDDFIRDRSEGLALRSQFLDFADENRWLAGLGYSLPGTYKQRTDFRVGGKLGSEPEIFAQGRYRRNFLINDRNLFHFRETLFWTNRDGFGATTSLDFDHVVNRRMLLRWGNIGTVSESTDGLEWRSAMLLYQSLDNAKALAYEVFVRGESAWEVPLKEWGARGIYRHPLLHRDWLAGEVVLGYSWPRFELEDERKGSLTIGLGLEILVGAWK